MLAVMKHELKHCFHSMTAYVFGAFLLLVVGLGVMMYNIESAYANFEYVLGFASMVFVIIVPILTMRVIAEERKQKTDQLLYSLPISTTEIILGKYFALLIVFLVPVCLVALYPFIVAQYGSVYLPTSYGTLVGFIFMGIALIALGIFISSLTENQGFAAGISIAIILFNYYSVTLSNYISSTALGTAIAFCVIILLLALLVRYLTKNDYLAYGVGIVLLIVTLVIYRVNSDLLEGILPSFMETFSLYQRFYTFVNGVFDLTAIVFFLTIAVFFLFLSVQSMEKRRYN